VSQRFSPVFSTLGRRFRVFSKLEKSNNRCADCADSGRDENSRADRAWRLYPGPLRVPPALGRRRVAQFPTRVTLEPHSWFLAASLISTLRRQNVAAAEASLLDVERVGGGVVLGPEPGDEAALQLSH